MDYIFTFHNVSINSVFNKTIEIPHENLHSIMYLLIRLWRFCFLYFTEIFTFHNVSINSTHLKGLGLAVMLFTFHNVSINSFFQIVLQNQFLIYIP